MSHFNIELKSLFIHIPKVAGLSLSNSKWNNGNGHRTLREYEKKEGISDDIFVWAFVRNPWERILSAYEGTPEVWVETPTFSLFINKLYKNIDRIRAIKTCVFTRMEIGFDVERIHFLPMHTLLRKSDGIMRTNFIGRYENLDQDYKIVCNKLNVRHHPLKVMHARSQVEQYRNTPFEKAYENEDLIDMVHEIYIEDIELFNYL